MDFKGNKINDFFISENFEPYTHNNTDYKRFQNINISPNKNIVAELTLKKRDGNQYFLLWDISKIKNQKSKYFKNIIKNNKNSWFLVEKPKVKFLIDSKVVILFDKSNYKLTIYDFEKHKKLYSFEDITAFKISNNFKRVALGKVNGDIDVFNINNLKLKKIANLKLHKGSINNIDFSLDGKKLLSVSNPIGKELEIYNDFSRREFFNGFLNPHNAVALWDIDNNKVIKSYATTTVFEKSIFLDNDKYIVLIDKDDVYFYDSILTKGVGKNYTETYDPEVRNIYFTKGILYTLFNKGFGDGEYLVKSQIGLDENNITHILKKDGDLEFIKEKYLINYEDVNDIAFFNNKNFITYCTYNKYIKIIDAIDGELLLSFKEELEPISVDVSSDDKLLSIAFENGDVKLVELDKFYKLLDQKYIESELLKHKNLY